TRSARLNAWNTYTAYVQTQLKQVNDIFTGLPGEIKTGAIQHLEDDLSKISHPTYGEIVQIARRLQIQLQRFTDFSSAPLNTFLEEARQTAHQRYHTHLYSQTPYNALEVPVVPPVFDADTPLVNGFQVLNKYFDELFENNPFTVAFGEDVGQIGDVNQGFAE